MTEQKFISLCKKHVAEYYGIKNYCDNDDMIYVVWLVKALQNNKALLSTAMPDGMYFECTYDGDKNKLYFDAYKHQKNIEFEVSDC